MAKRTNNVALPDSAELKQILETEVDFPVPADKQDVHYPRYATVQALLKTLQVGDAIFTDDTLSIEQVVAAGKTLTDTLVPKLLQADPSALTPHFNAMYDYLSESDTPEKSDVIFVFGAKTPLRAETAADLYHQSLAPQIVVSGGAPVYAEHTPQPEAEVYQHILLEHNIPTSAITIERRAITMADNVRRTLNQFEDQGYRPRSIILVNSPYSQRRGWAHFKKHLPDSVKLYRVNCSTGDHFARDNWFKQEDTLRVVLNEFIKMRASAVYNTA